MLNRETHAVDPTRSERRRLLVDVSALSRLTAAHWYARVAGDEFAVLCEAADESVVSSVAARVVFALAILFDVEGHPVSLSASAGVALNRVGPDTADDVLRRADAAMYRAKRGGKSRFELAY